MAATVEILGPARSLLRVRQQTATLVRVEGKFGSAGDAAAVSVRFDLQESDKRLAIEIDSRAWDELRERIDRAFVFEEPQ